MKSPILIILFFSLSILSAQDQLHYGEVPAKNSSWHSYTSREGHTIKVGDKILIGMPTTEDGFVWITQGGQKTIPQLAGVEVEIEKIRTFKRKFVGKAYLEFKGYGLLPVIIDYEMALRTGEIEDPF